MKKTILFPSDFPTVLPDRDYKINIVEFDYFGGNS